MSVRTAECSGLLKWLSNEILRDSFFALSGISHTLPYKKIAEGGPGSRRLHTFKHMGVSSLNDREQVYGKISVSSELKEIIPKCTSCGATAQNSEPEKPGYFVPKESSSEIKVTQPASRGAQLFSKYNSYFISLPKGAQAALLPGIVNDYKDNLLVGMTKQSVKMKKDNLRTICKHCQLSRQDFQKYALSRGPIGDSSILKSIQKSAKIVHVIDAIDFPLTIHPNIREFGTGGDILWVVNKIDKILPLEWQNNQRSLPYFAQILQAQYGVKPKNIFLTSSKLGWGIDSLARSLSKENYLVGYPNVGKSSLAKALASKYSSSKNEAPNTLHSDLFESLPYFTQGELRYDLLGSKSVYDMPSFEEKGLTNYYSSFKLRSLKDALKSPNIFTRFGTYNTNAQVLKKADQCFSVGGIVYIVLKSSESRVIVWPVISRSETYGRVFSSLEKALALAGQQNPENSKWFLNAPGSSNSCNHVSDIIVDGAGAEIVIRGLGVIHFRVSGHIPPEGISLQVHSLNDVKIMQRPGLVDHVKDRKRKSTQSKKSY